MLWFFERDGVHVSYEVRPSTLHPGFELLVRFPNGVERRELFFTYAAVLQRQLDLERQFEEHGWVEYANLTDETSQVRAKPRSLKSAS